MPSETTIVTKVIYRIYEFTDEGALHIPQKDIYGRLLFVDYDTQEEAIEAIAQLGVNDFYIILTTVDRELRMMAWEDK